MSRPIPHAFGWSRLVPLAFGTLAIAGLVLTDSRPLVAQAKKDVKEAKTEAKDTGDTAKDPSKKDRETAGTKRAPIPYVQQIPAPVDQLVNSAAAKQVNKINELIRANWIANKVNPSERCTDYEFIRRASLDIIGRIATESEIAQFMSQPATTRRSWLVEKLLAKPEFGENFAEVWTAMLLTRSGSKKLYQNQMREWLKVQFNAESSAETKDSANSQNLKDNDPEPSTATNGKADWSKIAMALLSATGQTNKNRAVNFVAHHIGEEIRQDESKKGRATPEELKENGRYDMVPITSRTTRLFLGVRTQCVQCHDHPFSSELQQNQFWGINAFFRQTTVSQRPGGMMMNKKKKDEDYPQVTLTDESMYNAPGIVSYERRSGLLKYTGMQFIDGKRVKTIPPGSSRRAELAKLIVDSPYFSKVFVNRTWAHFFGKSFTKDAPDDFGEHNPVTNPELLDFLADEFKAANYSPKDLVRWICNSQAYGLSSKANRWNDKPDDEVLFARMLLKTMSPEQMFDSLVTATARKKVSIEQLKAERAAWLDKLVLNFGNDEGEEGNFSGTVVQALMLMNGDDINKAITASDGTIASIIGEKGDKATPAAVTRIYMATLNRPPTSAELHSLADPRMQMFYNPNSKGAMNRGDFTLHYYQDIFWALLNSSEFILNH